MHCRRCAFMETFGRRLRSKWSRCGSCVAKATDIGEKWSSQSAWGSIRTRSFGLRAVLSRRADRMTRFRANGLQSGPLHLQLAPKRRYVMKTVTQDDFERAALEIGAHGDNDTLPFDIDTRFVRDNASHLGSIASKYFDSVASKKVDAARKCIDGLPVFFERLLAPTGPSGFRIVLLRYTLFGTCISTALLSQWPAGMKAAGALVPIPIDTSLQERLSLMAHNHGEHTRKQQSRKHLTQAKARLSCRQTYQVSTSISTIIDLRTVSEIYSETKGTSPHK